MLSPFNFLGAALSQAASAVSSYWHHQDLHKAWVTAIAVSAMAGASPAMAALSIQPITWDVVGLDSNNVNAGPNIFVVGARVTNSGAAPVSNVIGTFNWGNADATYLKLAGPATLSVPTLAAGAYTDFYFNVQITRNAASYDKFRPYTISAVADSEAAVSTPAGRQLYIESLVSQNRNSVVEFNGPTNVIVGQTYTYNLQSQTAPGGYGQVESFVNFPNTIFQITNVQSTYTVGGFKDILYYDACTWNNTTRACGTSAKAGGTITTEYTVKILAASGGTTTVTSLIYDFSGSSYHYNSDFGTGINAKSITAVEAAGVGTVTGHVYNDLNNNGVKDPGEIGVPNVDVRVVDSATPAGNVYVTDSSGNYSAPVVSGSVTVSVVTATLPPAVTVSSPGTSPQTFTVPNGFSVAATAIGLHQGPAIGGRVYLDINGNGIQDVDINGNPTDPGLANHPVMVGITPVNTNANGDYTVAASAGVPVTLSASVPANHYVTTANNPQSVIAINTGYITFGSNIGLQPRYTVQGLVWNDDDSDQLVGGSETGASGIGIQIEDAFGVIRSAVTNAFGVYSIAIPEGAATISYLSSTFGGKTVTTGNAPQNITVTSGANTPSPLGLASSAVPAGPTVIAGSYLSPTSLTVTFSESMGAGVLTAGNYTISGPGAGSLTPSPDTVTHLAGNIYTLTWNAGAMASGQPLTVTVNMANTYNAGGTNLETPNTATINVPASVPPPPPPPVCSCNP